MKEKTPANGAFGGTAFKEEPTRAIGVKHVLHNLGRNRENCCRGFANASSQLRITCSEYCVRVGRTPRPLRPMRRRFHNRWTTPGALSAIETAEKPYLQKWVGERIGR